VRTIGTAELTYVVLAARWTILLSVAALVGGGVLGALMTLGGISRWRPLGHAVVVVSQLVQGTPLLLLLLLAYFGSSAIGLDLGGLMSCALTFTLYSASFLTTIWIAAIEAVTPGQWEGARALGLRRGQQLRLVILPQALRLALPPTCGFVVQVIKNTSLGSIVGFIELTRAGQIVSNVTFQPLAAFGVVAAVYFVLCLPFTLLTEWLEGRQATPSHS
jgi:polar amino acid transport system permease protein